MNYYELLFTTIPTEDYQEDLLINALGEIGFDTFEEVDFGLRPTSRQQISTGSNWMKPCSLTMNCSHLVMK